MQLQTATVPRGNRARICIIKRVANTVGAVAKGGWKFGKPSLNAVLLVPYLLQMYPDAAE